MLRMIFVLALCLATTVYAEQYVHGNIVHEKNVINDNYNAFLRTEGSFGYEDSGRNDKTRLQDSDNKNQESAKQYTLGLKKIAASLAIGDRFDASESVNNKADQAQPRKNKPVSVKQPAIDIESSKTSVNLKHGLMSIASGQIKLKASPRTQDQRSDNVKNVGFSNDVEGKYQMRSKSIGLAGNFRGFTNNAAAIKRTRPLVEDTDDQFERNDDVLSWYTYDTFIRRDDGLSYWPNTRNENDMESWLDRSDSSQFRYKPFTTSDIDLDYWRTRGDENTDNGLERSDGRPLRRFSLSPYIRGSTNNAQPVNPGVNPRQRVTLDGVANSGVSGKWIPVYPWGWVLSDALVSPTMIGPDGWV